MKFKLTILLCFLSLFAHAVDIVTANVTITNSPTTNGMTFTVNGNVRTWTNAVTIPSSQIATNLTIGGSATNLFSQILATPYANITPTRLGTNGVTLTGAPGLAVVVSAAGSWAMVSYSTQLTANLTALRVPASALAGPVRTNEYSLAVTALNDYSTNTFSQTAVALTNFVNLTNAQTISGKTINGSVFSGGLTNATNRTLMMLWNTNGPNGIEFFSGTPARISTIAADINGLPTLYGTAINETPLTEMGAYTPSGGNLLTRNSGDTRYGSLTSSNLWTGTNSFARITNSVIANSSTSNTVHHGTVATLTGGVLASPSITSPLIVSAVASGTNSFAGQFSFLRGNNTTLANGNNAACDFNNGPYVKIKPGPTGAFAICGIAAGVNGRHLILHNATGQAMTIANNSGVDPTPANRIDTLTGADVTTTGNGCATLIYDSDQSMWVLIAVQL